jgi:DNA-binding transcriptional LysR family regulator
VERRRFVDGLVDLVTFELLEQVADLGTVTAAAGAMGITQQAASARLARAEQALGVRLVARAVTGATLTEHGGMVLEWAMPVLEAARRAETSLEALRNHDASIVIAASQTIAEYPLPGWLQTLRATSPSVRVRLLSGNSAEVVELVRRGAATVGFIERPEVPQDLHSVQVGGDELEVVTAPDHPWGGRTISPEQLASTPLVIREHGSGTRATLEAWLTREGRSLSVPAAELTTASAIRAAARSGVAPAVLSIRAVEDDLAAGHLARTRVDGPELHRPFTAVWSSAALDPTARLLIDTATAAEAARSHR